jgi:hypothetical protein
LSDELEVAALDSFVENKGIGMALFLAFGDHDIAIRHENEFELLLA